MTILEISAIKKIIEGSNTLTSAWGCGPVKIVVNKAINNPSHYSANIECPTGYYAIYLANILALVCSHLPHVIENKITIE